MKFKSKLLNSLERKDDRIQISNIIHHNQDTGRLHRLCPFGSVAPPRRIR